MDLVAANFLNSHLKSKVVPSAVADAPGNQVYAQLCGEGSMQFGGISGFLMKKYHDSSCRVV